MKNAILYARFSPRPNAKECDSVERQLADLRSYCRANDYRVIGEFKDEARSGGDRDRPGLADAVCAAGRGDTVLVRDWSRLGRDTLWALTVDEQLRKKRARLLSITEGELDRDEPTTRLMATILMAVAEFQRDMIRARTRAAQRRRMKQGLRVSKVIPYGWKENGSERLEKDDEEQRIIQHIRRWHGEGRSLRWIANRLTETGVTFRGRPRWNHQTVQKILERCER